MTRFKYSFLFIIGVIGPPIYSARLQCTNMAGQAPKKVANLIIRPGDTNQISMGPAFDSLKPYQRCSASGEARGP